VNEKADPASGAGELAGRVLKGFAAWNEGDLDGSLRMVRPDVRIAGTPPLARARMYRGHTGVRAFAAEATETYAEFRVSARTFHPLGDRQVLVLGSITGKRLDGHRFDLEAVWIYGFDEAGLVEELRTFIRPELAREQEFEERPRDQGRQQRGRILGRWGGEDRALIALDDGTITEVDCSEELIPHFEENDPVLVYLDARHRVVGWYLEKTGRGVDQRPEG
jgi:hypothetical protein